MKKYVIHESIHSYKTYLVDAKDEDDAEMIYESEGVLIRDKTLSSDMTIEEDD